MADCECEVCLLLRRMHAIQDKLSAEDAQFLGNFLDNWVNDQMDLEWYKAVADGSFPDAAKTLEGWLERAKSSGPLASPLETLDTRLVRAEDCCAGSAPARFCGR